MEYRTLGRTGLSTSVIGFGCGDVGGVIVRGTPEVRRQAVELAVGGGINYFDTAASYGAGRSEENLGPTLAAVGVNPFVGTKIRVEPEELDDVRHHVRRKFEEGLGRLGRERVDIITLHNPVGSADRSLPAETILGPVADAMTAVVDAGLAGAIGFTGIGETAGLLEVASSGRFDVVQTYHNPLNSSASRAGSAHGIDQDFDGLIDVATDNGTAIVNIRVLAGGAFTDMEDRHPVAGDLGNGPPLVAGSEYDDNLRRARRYREYFDAFGVESLAELAIRFAISNRRISIALVGVSDVAQVQAALDAEARGPLDDAVVEEIRSLAI